MLIDKIKATVANKVAVLKDINGNKVIPMTLTKAVQDDNGKKLSTILEEKMDKTQGSEISGWITTLNNKTFYAKGYYNGDMNNLVSVGCYLCGNEPTIKNKPNTTTWGTVTVFLGGTGSVTQEWVSADNVSKWYRHFNGSVWGQWREVLVDETIIVSDANNISQNGKYILTNTTLNKPSENADWYTCEATFENGGITGSITATCYAGHNLGRTYTRINLHGTWYDWKELATPITYPHYFLNNWGGSNVKISQVGDIASIVGAFIVGTVHSGTMIMTNLPIPYTSAVFEIYNGSVQSIGSGYVAHGTMYLSQVTSSLTTGSIVYLNVTYPILRGR